MIVAATEAGIHSLDTGAVRLAGHDVTMVAVRDGTWWALADRGRTLLRARGADGSGDTWDTVASVDGDAASVVHVTAAGDVYLGTRGAHVLRLDGGTLHRLDAFDAVAGRDDWYNPASEGRPSVWSLASDDRSVFASVHVGGLWRTVDGGATWTNLLVPDADIHQVSARDGLVAVAAQAGFALSRDGGDTWSWTTEGFHAAYLQAVALTRDASGAATVYVGASSGPFGTDGAVYRAKPPGAAFGRGVDGFPEPFDPIGPYHLAADGERIAAVAWGSGEVLVSGDGGGSWAPHPERLPPVHSLVATDAA